MVPNVIPWVVRYFLPSEAEDWPTNSPDELFFRAFVFSGLRD
jgi:hypothetical protein